MLLKRYVDNSSQDETWSLTTQLVLCAIAALFFSCLTHRNVTKIAKRRLKFILQLIHPLMTTFTQKMVNFTI